MYSEFQIGDAQLLPEIIVHSLIVHNFFVHRFIVHNFFSAPIYCSKFRFKGPKKRNSKIFRDSNCERRLQNEASLQLGYTLLEFIPMSLSLYIRYILVGNFYEGGEVISTIHMYFIDLIKKN